MLANSADNSKSYSFKKKIFLALRIFNELVHDLCEKKRKNSNFFPGDTSPGFFICTLVEAFPKNSLIKIKKNKSNFRLLKQNEKVPVFHSQKYLI